jgi:hypothetical protein
VLFGQNICSKISVSEKIVDSLQDSWLASFGLEQMFLNDLDQLWLVLTRLVRHDIIVVMVTLARNKLTGELVPIGKPKGVSIVRDIILYLKAHPEERNALVKNYIQRAIKGDDIATKDIIDRIDGKPVEHHIVEGELPIRLVFTPASALGVGQASSKPQVLEGQYKELEAGESEVQGQ